MEATAGIEPADEGFADLCLTTWLRRLLRISESRERLRLRQYSADVSPQRHSAGLACNRNHHGDTEITERARKSRTTPARREEFRRPAAFDRHDDVPFLKKPFDSKQPLARVSD
jgi:hypothetical protein